MFDDDVHENVNRTFDQVVKKSEHVLMDTTFDAPARNANENAVQCEAAVENSDSKTNANNNITFNKEDIINKTYPANDNVNLLNATCDLGSEEHAGINIEKHSGIDNREDSTNENKSITNDEILGNNLPVSNQTIILDEKNDFKDQKIETNKKDEENVEITYNEENISDYVLLNISKQEAVNRFSGAADLVIENAKAYCSSEFLENEAMLQLDDSFPTKLTDESLHFTPPANTSERKTKIRGSIEVDASKSTEGDVISDAPSSSRGDLSGEKAMDSNNVATDGGLHLSTKHSREALNSSTLSSGGGVKFDASSTEKTLRLDAARSDEGINSVTVSSEKSATNMNDAGSVETTKTEDDDTQRKSSSRCLKFDEIIQNNDNLDNKMEMLEDEVLSMSLVDGSYDLITLESMCAVADDKKSKSSRSESESSNKEVLLSFEAGKKSRSDDTQFNAAKKHRISRDEEIVDKELPERSETLQNDGMNSVVNSELNKDNCASNKTSNLSNRDNDQSDETDINQTLMNEPKMNADVKLENIKNDEDLNIDPSDSNSNTRHNNRANPCGAAAKDFSSLLSQTIEANDSLPALQNIGLKATTRRRSLVRRNTSPYFTSSLPNSLSPGPNFRMPKESTISETEDGSVIMDESSFRYYQNETKSMKTYLLRLKRILQEVSSWLFVINCQFV